MKKITTLFFLAAIVCLQLHAQNVGVGNTNPQAALDVQGDVRYRSTIITFAAGYNGELDATTNRASVYNINTMVTLTGINGGVDGRILTIVNTAGTGLIKIKLLDEADATSSPTLGNRMSLGGTFNINYGGHIVFRYDGFKQRWAVVSKTAVNDGTVPTWQQAGNDLYNSNTGNVGIGTTTPTTKLDVNGTIRIADGTQAAGKLLTSDAAGMASWQSPVSTGFKNLASFIYNPANQSWTVPAGVTKIFVEAWGGGGGGDHYTFNGNQLLGQGGGAGGYSSNLVDVMQGTIINITVGKGGRGQGNVSAATDGGSSYAGPAPYNNNFIYANGAGSGLYGSFGKGGQGSYAGVAGENGSHLQIAYGNSSASNYNLIIRLGDGGSAYHGGKGGKGDWFVSQNSASLLYSNNGSSGYSTATDGGTPGGGGGAGYPTDGGYGGNGLVLIYY